MRHGSALPAPRSITERATLLAQRDEIAARHLVSTRDPSPPQRAVAPEPPRNLDRERLVQVLEACAGNQTRAAKQLGISRTNLVQKIRFYNIPRPRM